MQLILQDDKGMKSGTLANLARWLELPTFQISKYLHDCPGFRSLRQGKLESNHDPLKPINQEFRTTLYCFLTLV